MVMVLGVSGSGCLPGLSPFTLLFCSARTALCAGWLRGFSPQHPLPLPFHLHSELCFLRRPPLLANTHSGFHSCFPNLLSPCTLLDCVALACAIQHLCRQKQTLRMSHRPAAVPAPLPAWSPFCLCPAIQSCKLPCAAESHSHPPPYLWWSPWVDTVRAPHRYCRCSQTQAGAGRLVNPRSLHCTSLFPSSPEDNLPRGARMEGMGLTCTMAALPCPSLSGLDD